VLALALLVLRLLYLAFLCPYSLIEDEANYWDWSRHLDWSYYTKGPGVAWTMWLTTQIFGNTEFGVRFAAPVAMSVACAAIGWLGYAISGKKSAALVSSLAFTLCPAFIVLGVIHTIDGPYVACWAVAACLAWKGLRDQRAWALALCGFVLGIAVLYKYTALLMVPGLLAFLLQYRAVVFSPRARGATTLGIFAGLILLVAASLPIVIWNAREGWPTIAHLLGHLGVQGGDLPPTQAAGKGYHYNPLWTLTFAGTLVALSGPALFVALSVIKRLTQTRFASSAAPATQDPATTMRMGAWFCFWVGAPVLAFYLLVSFVAEPEGNWSIAGFVTWMPLAGLGYALARDRCAPLASGLQLSRTNKPGRTWQEHFIFAQVILGTLLCLITLRADLAAHVPGLSRVVPTGRFTGAREIGAHAGELAIKLREETGKEPFVMATHYGRTALLAFYMPDQPTTFCVSSLTGGRRTSWDFWPETIVAGNTSLLGRPAIVIGADETLWAKHFDRVVNIGALRGDSKRKRYAYLCYGFRGMPLAQEAQP
jgi:hypothetical protein